MTQDITHTPISTLSERIKKTPKNNSKRGFWTGPRGESTYIPIDCQIEINHLLKQFGIIGITYIYGFPDFETCSIATVKILDMNTSRYHNFKQCDKACSIYWNKIHFCQTLWTPNLVKSYRKTNHLTWHERNDCTTCDLIPTKINPFFFHLGGVAQCRKIIY